VYRINFLFLFTIPLCINFNVHFTQDISWSKILSEEYLWKFTSSTWFHVYCRRLWNNTGFSLIGRLWDKVWRMGHWCVWMPLYRWYRRYSPGLQEISQIGWTNTTSEIIDRTFEKFNNKTNLIIQSSTNWWCSLLNRRLTSSCGEQRLLLLILQTSPLSCIIQSRCCHQSKRRYRSTTGWECGEAASNCTSSSSSSNSWSRHRSCMRKDESLNLNNLVINLPGIGVATWGSPWAWETWEGKDTGTVNWVSTDSSGLTFEGPWAVFALGAESKEAQLLSLEFVGIPSSATAVWGASGIAGATDGSGSSSKSIRLLRVSGLTSTDVPWLDAKLLEDAVLCNYNSQLRQYFSVENQFWDTHKIKRREGRGEIIP